MSWVAEMPPWCEHAPRPAVLFEPSVQVTASACAGVVSPLTAMNAIVGNKALMKRVRSNNETRRTGDRPSLHENC